MKKLIIAALILLSVFMLSCKENTDEKTNENTLTVSNYSIKETQNVLSELEALNETILYAPNSDNALDEDYFDYYFGDKSLFENITDYAYYTSATTSVCETGLFKVKDTATKTALLSAFETRKENLISTYENYSPEDVETAKNMLCGSFDDMVWFIITKDNQSIKEIIEK